MSIRIAKKSNVKKGTVLRDKEIHLGYVNGFLDIESKVLNWTGIVIRIDAKSFRIKLHSNGKIYKHSISKLKNFAVLSDKDPYFDILLWKKYKEGEKIEIKRYKNIELQELGEKANELFAKNKKLAKSFMIYIKHCLKWKLEEIGSYYFYDALSREARKYLANKGIKETCKDPYKEAL